MRLVAAALLCALFGCIPVEIKVNRAGAMAYRVENGIGIVPPDGGAAKTYRFEVEPIWLEWSPDGATLAFTADLGEDRSALSTLDPATGKVRQLVSHEALLWFPRYSPDGARIGYVLARKVEDALVAELRVIDVATRTDRLLAKNTGMFHAWTPDGRHVAAIRTNLERVDEDDLAAGSLVLVDASTGAAERLAHVAFSHWSHIRFSGRKLYYCTPQVALPNTPVDTGKVPYGLYAIDLDTRASVLVSRPGERVLYSAASPAGKGMLYVAARRNSGLEGRIVVVGADGSRTEAGRNHGNMFPFWTREGRIGFATKGKPKRLVTRTPLGKDESDITARFPGIEVK